MSIRFDANTDCLTRTTGLPAFGNWTSMVWVYRAVDNTVNEVINYVCTSNAYASYFGLALYGASVGPAEIYLECNAPFAEQFGSPLALTTWYHLALVFNDTANTLTAFLDGVQDAQITGVTFTFTPGFEVLGNADSGGAYSNILNGRVAYYRAYTAVLSAAEILAERNSATPVRTANLHRNTPLLVHTDVTDTTGTAHWTANGTLTTEADPPVSGGPSVTYVRHERMPRGLLRGVRRA